MSKKLLLGMLLCICYLSAACGKNNDVTENENRKLKWLLPAETENIDKTEEELVERELKKFFADRNIEVDLCFIDKDTYGEQITKVLQTDQEWDLMFLDQKLNQVMRSETRKFFAPITDQLNAENHQLYSAIPEYAWDVMTVNKEIYAIPNRHLWAGQSGFYVRTDDLKEYGRGLNPKEASSFEQIGSFLEKMTYEEGFIGTYIPQNRWEQELLSYGFYFSGDLENLGVIAGGPEGIVVQNMFETAEFEEYCNRMRSWYLDGYIREDSAVRDANATVISQDKKDGLFVLEPVENIAPGVEKLVEKAYGEEDSFVALPTSEIVISPNKVAEYSTAFSADSEQLSEAVAVAEEVYHNPELYNLILYGIEGKHYEKVNDRQIKKIPDSGYGANDSGAVESHALGNQYLSYVMEDEAIDKWERLAEWEKEAKIPATMGFFFRTNNVSDEIRNVSAILELELRLLETGSVDVDSFLPEFQGKLREAGAYRIMTEYQNQLTRWINNKSEY